MPCDDFNKQVQTHKPKTKTKQKNVNVLENLYFYELSSINGGDVTLGCYVLCVMCMLTLKLCYIELWMVYWEAVVFWARSLTTTNSSVNQVNLCKI